MAEPRGSSGHWKAESPSRPRSGVQVGGKALEAHLRMDVNWLLVLLLAGFALAPLTYPGFVQAWQGFAPAYALQDLRAGHPLGFWGVAWPPHAGAEGPLPHLLSAAWKELAHVPPHSHDHSEATERQPLPPLCPHLCSIRIPIFILYYSPVRYTAS